MAREQADVSGSLPLGFLRAEVGFRVVRSFAKAGYLSAHIDDVDGQVLDLEAQLIVRPAALVEVRVRHGYVNIALDSLIETIGKDLAVSGLNLRRRHSFLSGFDQDLNRPPGLESARMVSPIGAAPNGLWPVPRPS